tara:strand:+ start:748 stop:2373 length:1626 start_codon:yes stop_codon:yes gene_type:complete
MNLTAQQKQEYLKKMYVDPFFFAQVLFGDKEEPMHYHLRSKTPDFHREIVDVLLNLNDGEKLAVVAPRGHAKTTLCSLIYPLHRILFGEEHFVLLISESETQSKYLLETIGDEVEFNPRIQYFFGNRMGSIWGKEEKEFIGAVDHTGKTTNKCKVLIRGTGQKVRGLKYGAYRPTLTIIDDGEGEANTVTELQREKFRRWINGAVIPGSADAKLVFVGTIVDDDSYLNRIAGAKSFDRKGNSKVKGWKTMFFQSVPQANEPGKFSASGNEIIEKTGIPKVLWKQHRPYKWLMAEKDRLISEGDAAFFFQEYQNIPMDDSFRVFKKEHIQYYEGHYLKDGDNQFLVKTTNGVRKQIPINVFMGIDPASSENIKADYSAILMIGVDDQFNIYILDMFRGQIAPFDCGEKIFEYADKYHPKTVNIEETGHFMLRDYVFKTSKETGRFLNIMPKKAIKAKYFRLKEMQPYFASKAVFMKDEHFELEQELLAFKEHGTFKKDTLDALRWAMDDMYKPSVSLNKAGEWVVPNQIVGCDWETGRMLMN